MGWAGLAAKGKVALEVAHGAVVGVDVLARGNALCGLTNNLAILEYLLAGSDALARHFVHFWNVGAGR